MTTSDPQHPDHSMTAILPTSDQTQLFATLQSFKTKYGLKAAYGYRSLDGKDFLLDMSSDKLTIEVLTPSAGNVYEVASYVDKPSDMSKPTTNDLMDALRTDLEAMPGVKVKVDY